MLKPVVMFLLLMIIALSSNAQSTDTTRTVLYGTVRDEFGRTLQNTYILLKGSPWGTTTDSSGNYSIDITGYLKTSPKPEVEFQHLGYVYVQYTPAKELRGVLRYDLKFKHRHKKKDKKHKH